MANRQEIIPQWHADVLARREKAFESGIEKAIDWSLAKSILRTRIQAAKEQRVANSQVRGKLQ